jgi:chitin synthase
LLFFIGEDRWLCTLLLQEGYRVEYCAASDALTYAPESFHVSLVCFENRMYFFFEKNRNFLINVVDGFHRLLQIYWIFLLNINELYLLMRVFRIYILSINFF